MRYRPSTFAVLAALGTGILHSTAWAGSASGDADEYDVIVTEVADLATAGLGVEGLASATPPEISSPPTVEDLRKLAIYNNYRALTDNSAGGGFGSLFGPPDEAIPGKEYLAFEPGKRGRQNISMLVQIPQSFDPHDACLVTGPSSGSRGVYGAIGTSGEWGLANNCAVVYTDKGTGTGAHNLTEDTVGLIDGIRADAEEAGRESTFTAKLRGYRGSRFTKRFPDRWAFKHAHSRFNPEADWGLHVIQSIEFAMWALSQEHEGIDYENTIVIASSVSNGGGASLLAAEMAPRGLIDGVVVSEPNVNPKFDDRFVIRQGDDHPIARHSRTLYDYTTLLNLYQGCANQAPSNALAPFNFLNNAERDGNRCAGLAQKGLLEATDLAGQAEEAQAIINDYGIPVEQNPVQPVQWASAIPQAIAVTYANAYARASVVQQLCGYGFAATTPEMEGGTPAPIDPGAEAILFATSNGIPPTGGINLVNEHAPDGPVENSISVSPSTGLADQNLDGALCLRALELGHDPVSGDPLTGRLRYVHERLQEGVHDILAHGDLRGTPTLIVQGRADAILPINHTGRPYFALNQLVEGDHSRTSFIEILNAQHLDTLNALPGFDALYIPLHHYFIEALDLMYAHLRDGAHLPPSQVVRTVPRGTGDEGSVPPIDEAINLPAIAMEPHPGDKIVLEEGVLIIPE